MFNLGDERVVHTIIINHNIILCENGPYEDFFSNLALDSGIQPITVIRPRIFTTLYASYRRSLQRVFGKFHKVYKKNCYKIRKLKKRLCHVVVLLFIFQLKNSCT